MADVVTVTEVARNFSDIINRVQYQSRTYLLTRGGQTVAQLSAVNPEPLTFDAFVRLWKARPRLDPADAVLWESELAAAKAQIMPALESVWDS